MYIWTTGQEILNLDNYKKVDVYFLRHDSHLLYAGDPPDKTTIAIFSNKADAMYAQCLLFKGLMEGAKAWDASAVPLLSDIWKDIKGHLSSEDKYPYKPHK